MDWTVVRLKTLVAAVITSCLFAAEGSQACMCVPRVFNPDDYDTIFLGRALDTSKPYQSSSDYPYYTARFVLLASWSGVIADTLYVRAEGASDCGSYFEAGREYLVTADHVAGEEDPFVFGCGHTILRTLGAERVIRLGEPVFRSPGVTLPGFDEAKQVEWLSAIAEDTRSPAIRKVGELGLAGRPLIPGLLELADDAEPEDEGRLLGAVFRIDPGDAEFVAYAKRVLVSGDDRRVFQLITNLRGVLSDWAPLIEKSGKRRKTSVGEASPGLLSALPIPESLIRSSSPELRGAAIDCLGLAVGDCDSPWIPVDDRGDVLDASRHADVLRVALADSLQAVRGKAWLHAVPDALREPGFDRAAITRWAVEDCDNPWILNVIAHALDCGVEVDAMIDVQGLLDVGFRSMMNGEEPKPVLRLLDGAIRSGIDLRGLMCDWCSRSSAEQPEGIGFRCEQYSGLGGCSE